MYFGNLGMRMMMASQMPMGLWGNFGAMNYTNQMFPFGGSIFNQFPMMNFNYSPMFYPMPTWNFGSTATGTTTTTTQTQDSTNKTIDEIRKLNYDSPELKTKLDKNNKIADYANYLTSNSSYKLTRTIDANDGGKIYMYEDKDGNQIGSINKDKNGKIRNVSLTLADGGEISLNDHQNNDGIVDSRTAISKNDNISTEVGKKLDYELKNILKKFPNAKDKTIETRANGDVLHQYTESDGEVIVTVLKDSKGKIIQIINQSASDGKKQIVEEFSDGNKNGKVDTGEHIKHYNIEL